MPMPRVRFTVRRMMIDVVLAAFLTLPVARMLGRSREFERLSREHRTQAGAVAYSGVGGLFFASVKSDWHYRLSMKYRRAARAPWLPVAPDPTEPE
jgi:hypothetical protein